MLKLGHNFDIGGTFRRTEGKMDSEKGLSDRSPSPDRIPAMVTPPRARSHSPTRIQPHSPRRHDIQQLIGNRSRSRSRSRSPSPHRITRRESANFQPSRITAHARVPPMTYDAMTSRIRSDPEAHPLMMPFYGMHSISDPTRKLSNPRSPLAVHDLSFPLNKLNTIPYMDSRVPASPDVWLRHMRELQEAHARSLTGQLQSYMYSQAIADPLMRPYLSMAPHVMSPMVMTPAMPFPMAADLKATRRSTGRSSEASTGDVIRHSHRPQSSGYKQRHHVRDQVTRSSRGIQAEDTDSDEEDINISVDVDDSSPTTTTMTTTPTTSKSDRRPRPPSELSSPDTTTHSPGNSPPFALRLQHAPPALPPHMRLPLSAGLPFYAAPCAAGAVPGVGLPPLPTAHPALEGPHPGIFPFPSNGRRPRDPTKPPPLKKYKCDLCGKAFSRSNTLVTHRRIHTGEKPFKCEVCGRAFRQPGNLTRHRLTHTTVKPFVCPVCNKAFNRASNLHTHMRTHSNFKPFICQFCGKTFNQKVDLKIHTYSHTGRVDEQ